MNFPNGLDRTCVTIIFKNTTTHLTFKEHVSIFQTSLSAIVNVKVKFLHDPWIYITINTMNNFLVSKETVVLRRWEIETGKCGVIKRVDKGRNTTVNDLES